MAILRALGIPCRIHGFTIGKRWAVENEGIRELPQRCRVRVPIGRSQSAIYAQLLMLAMCYNAMKDYAMKKPKDAEALQEECRRRARRSCLAGKTVLVFIPRRRIYMVTNGRTLTELSEERTIRRLEALLAAGVPPKEAVAQVRRAGL